MTHKEGKERCLVRLGLEFDLFSEDFSKVFSLVAGRLKGKKKPSGEVRVKGNGEIPEARGEGMGSE